MNFGDPRPRRRPSLTPMIDVVFLLLVFFMLASRFGIEQVLPLKLAGQGAAEYSGPPRIVDVTPDEVRLNGVQTSLAGLADAVSALASANSDVVVLRGRDGADVQRIVDIAEALTKAGFGSLVVVE
ncbi:MAG: biopolymer transporter ExbD [Pseudomonadota bacterium]